MGLRPRSSRTGAAYPPGHPVSCRADPQLPDAGDRAGTRPRAGRVRANSSLVTTFNVEPRDGKSLVRISASWDGASGVGGFFERTFAPKALPRIYLDELDRLNAYAAAQR